MPETNLPQDLHTRSTKQLLKLLREREDLQREFERFLTSDAYKVVKLAWQKLGQPRELTHLSGGTDLANAGGLAYNLFAGWTSCMEAFEGLHGDLLEERLTNSIPEPWGHVLANDYSNQP